MSRLAQDDKGHIESYTRGKCIKDKHRCGGPTIISLHASLCRPERQSVWYRSREKGNICPPYVVSHQAFKICVAGDSPAVHADEQIVMKKSDVSATVIRDMPYLECQGEILHVFSDREYSMELVWGKL